ncbi:FAD:protein FMN transferase [Faecalicatena contorta]|uniref:FAD:protein FMN transferase n=1 Tax=Faecalicatena contorta TaxID=39482 RepID=UPI001F2A3361|nr:FAD:protein FMN transferase [Faecalicatena contorta]MCF2554447.1 FAD:protein FMN transferase [Faecalicatena contorta]
MKYKKLIAAFSAAAIFMSGCSGLPSKDDLSYTDTLFDTVISVQILDPVDKDILEGCEKLCKDYDVRFSTTNEDSEIYKINHAGGAAVEVSEDTITLIKKGIYYGDFSNGLFDITIGSVTTLWDFHAEDPVVPDASAVASALSHVNYKNIIISDNTVRLADPNAAIDVGAIAKGYIADRLKDYLKENGVKHAVINLGGNVLTLGTKTDGSKYNIGIQKPFDETGTPITSVKIADQSIVTTGIYQRYFEVDGKLYHHIIDPNTGYPCENDLYSVSIITDSSLTADALSTVYYLMGYERANALNNQLNNVDAVFITNDEKIHYTDNFMN